MRGTPTSPDATPGTGEQYALLASPPESEGEPNILRANGTKWMVGHDYLDTEIGDVCTLTEVFAKSSWCDTRPADESSPKLRFEYERFDHGPITLDPNDPSGEIQERFIERYTSDPPLGSPAPPW